MMKPCALTALEIFNEASCGDVVAACRCATTLLADVPTCGRDLACERLLLTAALIHLQSDLKAHLTLCDLSVVVKGLSTAGPTRRAFARSPSLLVQYVAAAVEEGDLSAALSATSKLFVNATAQEDRARARLRPCSPPSERRRPKPSTRKRRPGGASTGDRT